MNNKWRNSVSAVLASVARPPTAVRPSSRVLGVPNAAAATTAVATKRKSNTKKDLWSGVVTYQSQHHRCRKWPGRCLWHFKRK
jgi:hypothetical protein